MILYKITNLMNGMVYIGQTTRQLNVRLNEHASHATHLGSAIRKHGKENFNIEVLHTATSIEELNALEAKYVTQEFVESTNTYDYRLGGGNVGFHSAETRQKMSDAKRGENHPMFGKFGEHHQAYGYRHTDEAKAKSVRRGEQNGNFGKKGKLNPLYGKTRPDHSAWMKEYCAENPKVLSAETKQKLSDINTGKRLVRFPDGKRIWVDALTLKAQLSSGDIQFINGKYYRGGLS